ncbi:MipA/OmpV family protein [Aestuariispira insulae]|uniref:Outer membrane scaffolding protein for murein synthesis (MipA/OmpV family) n=1 Tax=Aestuariispira insulae TaxID=1461337 RepID=A0A3D9HDZ8_9PROT|nr:MipA/OmpV family protein [Aestuariispira insulae]RED47695.1 outer membrane scaffolding protein for murein synthesis (MipA/OmpV family) [Aestuariispira insulae]
MKKTNLFSPLIIAGMATAAAAAFVPHSAIAEDQGTEEWSFETGLAAMYAPDYEGSDDYEIAPVPLLEISWNDRITLTTYGGPGLYAKAYGTEDFRVDLGIRYEGGREASDNDALGGLGNMDVGAVAVGAVSYEMGPMEIGLELAHDLGGDRKGTAATLEAEYAMPVFNGQARLTIAPHLTWVNEDYMDNSFGITASQAASSTLGLAQYDPAAGLRDVGLTLGVGYPVTDNVLALARVDYSRLMSEAADSPLVKDQGSANQMSAIFGLVYKW